MTKKTTPRKAATKKTVAVKTKKASNKVDFEPNKMTFAISALAVVSLFLLVAIITV